MVYCTCLENRSAVRYQRFESSPLRRKVLGYPARDGSKFSATFTDSNIHDNFFSLYRASHGRAV